jgi:hypothetical protein
LNDEEMDEDESDQGVMDMDVRRSAQVDLAEAEDYDFDEM